MSSEAILREHFRGRYPMYNVASWDGIDLAYRFTNATQALLAAALFCPALVEIDGSILLESAVDREGADREFRELRDGSGRAHAEHSFNLLEVDYLFAENPDGETMNEPLSLAIAEAWRAWLRYKYPDREFVVTTADREETLDSLEVRFYEARCEADHENAKLEVVRG